jgi:hypothetical protein
MAWHTGTMTPAAGEIITLFDSALVANDNWSIYDGSAGANKKVYRCTDGGVVDFYVSVDDNQADYAIIELWEGWDDGAHTGTGDSRTTINTWEMRIYKPTGGYAISVRDLCFVFVNTDAYLANYVGQLDRFDTTKDMPIFIGATKSETKNPIGFYNLGDSVGWACLWDEGGTSRTLTPDLDTDTTGTYIKTTSGTIAANPISIRNSSTDLLMGTLYGCASRTYDEDNGLTSGETISINGVDWLVVGGGGYYCLVEKA